MSDDEIPADSDGNPLLERRLYLLDCPLTEGDIKTRYPSLWEYLEEGKSRRVAKRYLCRHPDPGTLRRTVLPRRSSAPTLAAASVGRPTRLG